MQFGLNLDEIKYIKILYKDTDGSKITKAAIKTINEKQMLACAKFEQGLNIITPQEITLSIVCLDGLYRTKTVLKSIENDEPYTFFMIETPQGLEYQQNREYFRVPLCYKAKYFPKTTEGYFVVQTVDISANGVTFIIPELVIADEDTKFNIIIEGFEIYTKIRYVRSEKIENGYKISFRFTQILESDRDFISQVCIKKQLEEKRNRLV